MSKRPQGPYISFRLTAELVAVMAICSDNGDIQAFPLSPTKHYFRIGNGLLPDYTQVKLYFNDGETVIDAIEIGENAINFLILGRDGEVTIHLPLKVIKTLEGDSDVYRLDPAFQQTMRFKIGPAWS